MDYAPSLSDVLAAAALGGRGHPVSDAIAAMRARQAAPLRDLDPSMTLTGCVRSSANSGQIFPIPELQRIYSRRHRGLC